MNRVRTNVKKLNCNEFFTRQKCKTPGDRLGVSTGSLREEWRKWADHGLIDSLESSATHGLFRIDREGGSKGGRRRKGL